MAGGLRGEFRGCRHVAGASRGPLDPVHRTHAHLPALWDSAQRSGAVMPGPMSCLVVLPWKPRPTAALSHIVGR